MIRFERVASLRFISFPFPVFLLCFPALADELPPDREAAELIPTWQTNPDDAVGWIRLADLQRLMGYGHKSRASFAEAAALIKKLPKEEKLEMAAAVLHGQGLAGIRHDQLG